MLYPGAEVDSLSLYLLRRVIANHVSMFAFDFEATGLKIALNFHTLHLL